jgi:hypothetical protein
VCTPPNICPLCHKHVCACTQERQEYGLTESQIIVPLKFKTTCLIKYALCSLFSPAIPVFKMKKKSYLNRIIHGQGESAHTLVLTVKTQKVERFYF